MNDKAPRQSDTATVAKSLLGNDLAEKWGDVLGSREPAQADVDRDMSVAATSGQPVLDSLKSRVIDTYNAGQQAAANSAQAAEDADRMKVKAISKGFKTVRENYSPGTRTSAYAAILEQYGVAADKTVLKELEAEAEEGGLPADEVISRMDGGLTMEDLQRALGSVMGYARFVRDIKETQGMEGEAQAAASRLNMAPTFGLGEPVQENGSKYTVIES